MSQISARAVFFLFTFSITEKKYKEKKQQQNYTALQYLRVVTCHLFD